ncbi:MAG: mechanosensitive ion channel protein MscS, partial [Betaproteobacteria bacterium]|nr:mechanosensitive ion channel protein MscS [Betaproteobacteria bacterium]
SEMPLLGYFGYLPFGILVWIFFIWSGKLFGFDPDLGLDESTQRHP